jgi:hypothetical protein
VLLKPGSSHVMHEGLLGFGKEKIQIEKRFASFSFVALAMLLPLPGVSSDTTNLLATKSSRHT